MDLQSLRTRFGEIVALQETERAARALLRDAATLAGLALARFAAECAERPPWLVESEAIVARTSERAAR